MPTREHLAIAKIASAHCLTLEVNRDRSETWVMARAIWRYNDGTSSLAFRQSCSGHCAARRTEFAIDGHIGRAISFIATRAELALPIAAGSTICGAAAVLCVKALTRAREQNTGLSIALITLAGTLALLVFPFALGAGWMPASDDGATASS